MWKSNDVTTVRRPFSNWRIKFLSCSHIINCKNANEIQTKTLKYLYQNNTRILRQEWQKNFLRRKKQYKKWIDWVNTFARIESQTLFVQFWSEYAHKKHFNDQTVHFTLTFLQNLEISFDGLRILSMLVLYVIADYWSKIRF